jgi:hypothetical protein
VTGSPEWIVWLERTPFAAAMRESLWLYPAVETAHIVGFVVLVGAAAMFDLRLLGVSRRLPVDETARHLLPWSRASLLLVVPTGLLLFASDASATWANPAFRLKMILLGCAGANALFFHRSTFRTVAAWNRDRPTPARAKGAAVASLLLWTGVISCGRLIAYF